MTWIPGKGFVPTGTAARSLAQGGDVARVGSDAYVTFQDLIDAGILDPAVGGTGRIPSGRALKLTDAVSTALADSLASIEINSPSLFKKMNGAAGVIIGAGGITGYNSAGTATITIDASTGDVTLTGTITATVGAIGGMTLSGSALYTGSKTAYNDTNAGVHYGTDGIGFGNNVCTISAAGAAVFTNISVTGGNINTTGYIRATAGVAEGGYTACIVGAPAASGVAGGYFAGNAQHGAIGFASASGYAGVRGYSSHASGHGGMFGNSASGSAIIAEQGTVRIVDLAGAGRVLYTDANGVLGNASGLIYSAGTLTTTTFSGALSGNATTATTLQTARTINGTSFDGSANITVTAAAGTLTGTTLASGVTASSLTSVGTLGAHSVSGAITPNANGTLDLGGTSAYWASFYAIYHFGAGHLRYASSANQTATGWGMDSLHATHDLSAGSYYGGAVPTQGTAPFEYHNIDGKVVLYIDAHGVAYNSATPW